MRQRLFASVTGQMYEPSSPDDDCCYHGCYDTAVATCLPDVQSTSGVALTALPISADVQSSQSFLEDLDMLNLTDISSNGQPSEPDAFLSALNALCEENDASSDVPGLPQFTPLANPVFTWGELDAATFTNSLNSVYAEAIHWRKNLFRVPYGRVGKDFVFELAKLYHTFANGSAFESIALKAASLMPVLLLQKPACRFKTSDLISCLERHLDC